MCIMQFLINARMQDFYLILGEPITHTLYKAYKGFASL